MRHGRGLSIGVAIFTRKPKEIIIMEAGLDGVAAAIRDGSRAATQAEWESMARGIAMGHNTIYAASMQLRRHGAIMQDG